MTLDEMTLIIRELLEGDMGQEDMDAMITRVEEATGYPDVLEILEQQDELSPEEMAKRIVGYPEREA